MAGFDISGARQAGYSDGEIADYLTKNSPDAFDFDGARKAGYNDSEIVKHLEAQANRGIVDKAAEAASTGKGAIVHGGSEALRGIGKTLKAIGATDTGEKLEKTGESLAPQDYTPAMTGLMNPKKGDTSLFGYGVGYIPQAVAESLPALGTDMTAGYAGGKLGSRFGPIGTVIGGAGGAIGSYALRNYGSNLESRVEHRTGDAKAEPSTEDKIIAGLQTGGEGALGAIGVNRLLNPARITDVGVKGALQTATRAAATAGIEGGVGAGQNVIGQVGRTVDTPGGVNVDPREAGAAGLVTAATGSTIGAKSAVKDLITSARLRGFGGDLSEASTQVANRIVDKSGGTENLEGGIIRAKGDHTGFNAVRDAESDIHGELSRAVAALPKDSLSTDAQNALNRVKDGRGLDARDLATVDRAVSGVEGGDAVANLTRQATAIAKLKDLGKFNTDKGTFTGGLSTALKSGLRALQNPWAPAAAVGLSSLGLTGNAASLFAYSPHALAAIGGGYYGAKAVDKAVGTRNPALTFAERFANPDAGIRPNAAPAPDATVQPNTRPTGPLVPPAPTPWGAEPPADPSFNPRSNIMIDEGMAKIAKGIGNTRAKQMAQAERLLAQLATRNAAPEPTPQAPEPAAPIDPNNLPRSITAPARNIMSGAANSQGMKIKYENGRLKLEGLEQANQEAGASPYLAQTVGTAAVQNPEAGKRMGQMLSNARAILKMRSDPEAESDAAAEAAAEAKATKDAAAADKAKARSEAQAAKQATPKLNGKANGKAAEETTKINDAAPSVEEAPFSQNLKHTQVNELDRGVAAKAADEFAKSGKPQFVVDRYRNSTEQRQARIRDRLMELSSKDAFPADDIDLAVSLDRIRSVRRRSELSKAVEDIAATTSPEVANLIRAHLGPKWAATVWNEK